MAFVKRFGGWRPVQLEEGEGVLRLPEGEAIESVAYRFEVWHQMVDGFPGPFRSEGEVVLSADQGFERIAGRDVVLVLADGRLLPLRIDAVGGLLAHTRPSAT